MTDAQMLAKALKVLKARGMRVEKRERYYTGNHPTPPGSVAWSKTFGPQLKGIRDNQCKPVVNAHADALVPSGAKAKSDDKVEVANAAWVTERIVDEAATFDRMAKDAEALGEQVVVAVDYNLAGEVDFYPFDPRSAYMELGRGGEVLWMVHFWKVDEDGDTQATIETPDRVAHLTSSSASVLPSPDDFRLVEERPNVFGEVMAAVVDKHGSVIDDISPLNDILNKLLQTSMVVSEGYALPRTVWMGLETYDASTGEVTGPKMTTNPATGSRDVSFPTVADAEGDARNVIQLPSPEPEKYLKDQDNTRASIARNGCVPASKLQLGGVPASGDALEMEYIPYIGLVQANRRSHYRPFHNRLARLAIRRRMYKVTGQPVDVAPVEIQYPPVAVSTTTTRTNEWRAAIDAGMTLSDALVEFMGWDREAADLAEQHSDTRANAASDRAVARAEQGFLD